MRDVVYDMLLTHVFISYLIDGINFTISLEIIHNEA